MSSSDGAKVSICALSQKKCEIIWTVLQKKRIFALLSEESTICLSYGVMVAQQFLVLFD